MAIAFAKITILVGAGVVGTILSKEGGLGDVSNLISGAFKIVRKLQEDKGNSSSSSKPANDYLLTQVNSLRKQLQNLQESGSGPVTIVTKSSSGSGTYRITAAVLLGVAGYGYAWWKGWKISDLMYVTRRRWYDARESVAKQVDQVSTSVSSTRRVLSSRIDRVNCSLNDCLEASATNKAEATGLHSDVSGFHDEVASVHRAVRSLESKLFQIEGTQDFTTKGVYHLCQFVKNLESRTDNPRVLRSNSARPALEDSSATPLNRASSLPSTTSPKEHSSASTSKVDAPRVLRSSRALRTDSLKEVQGLISVAGTSSSAEPDTSMVSRGAPSTSNVPRSNANNSSTSSNGQKSNGNNSTSVRVGWRGLPRLSFLTRTRDTADSS